MKEENFWRYHSKNIEEATKQAEELIKWSGVPGNVDGIDYFYHVNNLSVEEVASIILMNNYMQTQSVSPKELEMSLLSITDKSNKKFKEVCAPAISALSKFPDKHAWTQYTSKKDVLKMTNEEIFENDIRYTLEELKEHGSKYVILAIPAENKKERKNDKKLF